MDVDGVPHEDAPLDHGPVERRAQHVHAGGPARGALRGAELGALDFGEDIALLRLIAFDLRKRGAASRRAASPSAAMFESGCRARDQYPAAMRPARVSRCHTANRRATIPMNDSLLLPCPLGARFDLAYRLLVRCIAAPAFGPPCRARSNGGSHVKQSFCGGRFWFFLGLCILVPGTALGSTCPVGRNFWTTGTHHGCKCPSGHAKEYNDAFRSRAHCEPIITVAPVFPSCNISCVTPPLGCHYEGQRLSGSCSVVTCGRLVCGPIRPPRRPPRPAP